MTALPLQPNTVKVRFHFLLGVDAAATVIKYFSYSGPPPTNTVAAALALGFDTVSASDFPPMCADPTVYESCDVLDLSSYTGGYGTHSTPSVGTRGSELLPGGAAVLVNY